MQKTRNNLKNLINNTIFEQEDQEDDEDNYDELNRQSKELNNSDHLLKLKNDNLNFIVDREKIEENFHITHSKIQLADVTFKTMEKNILANHHIILCGIVPNLVNFILPL